MNLKLIPKKKKELKEKLWKVLMELKDVKTILKRIEINYPNFLNDTYTQAEWYKELKDYSLEDVMGKLEQHFRSEQYGNTIPKVYFLTKYLTKEQEKGLEKKYYVRCQYCNASVLLSDYDKHSSRCRSIKYIQKQANKYANAEIDEEELRALDDESFNNYYNKVLKIVEKHTMESNEKRIIGKILYDDNLELKDIDLV
nr:MAG TPA: Loader and inhibitor of phage G40P [Caudoviricetes sp.]